MLYQQPQFGPLFIDWSNPISRKLAAAFDPVSGNVYSGTASKKSVSANTSARGVTQQGKTALTSGSAAYIALAGDSIFSANLWTSVSVVSFPSIVTPSAISTVAASPGSTVADRSLYIDASGHLLAFLYDNVSNQQAVDPAVLLANTPYVLAAESNGSTVKAWKNGVNVASTATANGGYTGYSPAPQFVIGYGSGNSLGGTLASNANIALQLWFSPNLTAAEHASIAANPWQLFLDPDEDDEALMFSMVGGGTDTPIDAGVGIVGLTGYAPSVAQSSATVISLGTGTLAIIGYAPTIHQPQVITVSEGTIAIIGYMPAVTQGATTSIVPGLGSLALLGYAPGVVQSVNQMATPNSGALIISGRIPSVTQTANQSLSLGTAAIALTGWAPTVWRGANQGVALSVSSLFLSTYTPLVTVAPALVIGFSGGRLRKRPITDVSPFVIVFLNGRLRKRVATEGKVLMLLNGRIRLM